MSTYRPLTAEERQRYREIIDRAGGSREHSRIRTADGVLVVDYVAAEVGGGCMAEVTQPSVERKRVTISCPQGDGLPARTLRGEFGDPGGAEE